MASTMPTVTATTNPSSLAQGVYMMPMQQQSSRPRTVRPVPGVKCLSIATIVLAGVLVLLGITAAVIKARRSFLGNAVWTGLLFLLATGILGIFVYKKQNNLCMNISYLVMTIVSSVATFQLFCYTLDAATMEYPWRCNPDPDPYYHYDDGFLCAPIEARVTVDVVIVLCALAALVLCIISFCLTMYGTFNCCYSCCYNCCSYNSPGTVQYSPNTGYIMTTINGHNAQVMTPVQMVPPGSHQASSQPFLVASPQSFTPNTPPAYMAATNGSLSASPQNMVASENAQLISGATHFPTGNQGPPSGNTQSNENKLPPAVDPSDIVPTNGNRQIAGNPQNWQKF